MVSSSGCMLKAPLLMQMSLNLTLLSISDTIESINLSFFLLNFVIISPFIRIPIALAN